MNTRSTSLAVLLVLGACTPHPAAVPDAPPPLVVQYRNGLWFDGQVFQRGDRFVRGEQFVPPTAARQVIDLQGQHVVPPFGEAHNHNIDPQGAVAKVLAGYLRAGVFYVQNPNNLPGARAGLAGRINHPGTVDVAFANGGLTSPGGHPTQIARANIARGRWTESDGDGAFYFSVRDESELARRWPQLVASRPDFVKIYLLYGDQGLAPALIPTIVQRARRAGLRVAAHVETAGDFHTAVAAGVDLIAHTPGFRGDRNTRLDDPGRFRIQPDDARAAARQGTVVVTTLAGLAKYADEQHDAALRRAADELNRSNLALLHSTGVAIAVGSDEYGDNSVGEARYLASLKVLSPAALLRSWCEVTPRAIFPGRRIGRLQPGYEASFLVLAGDPLADFAHTGHVVLAVKQGQRLDLAPALAR